MAQQPESAARTLTIEYLSTSSLVPDPRNARKHSKKQIAHLTAAIGEFGFTNPILIDEKRGIIAGHARLEAARCAGLEAVPCVHVNGLTEPQKRALSIADNKLGDMSEFDLDVLAATLAELDGIDFNVELIGFDTAEVDIMLGAAAAATPKSDPADFVPTTQGEAAAVTVAGDLWLLGDHRLLCSNALEEASYTALLGGDRADLVFSDMPYNVPISGHVSGLGKARHREFAMASGEMSNVAFTQFLTTAMSLMAQYSVDGSIHFQCMDFRHAAEILTAGASVYSELKNLCIWDKGSGGMGSLYRAQHELVFVFKNGTAPHVNNVQLGRFGRYRTNVWRYPGLNSFGKGRDDDLASHPTVKPVALVADAIRDCSKRGSLVLDPFAGSGTTIIAAGRTRRRAAAMEIDPIYVDTAVNRWQALTGGVAILANDGRSYAEIAAERSATPVSCPVEVRK
jgi:DNA modification methylase